MIASRLSVKPAPASVAAARTSVRAKAADRPTWYPGATPPKSLDGTMPGDYGFDPLRLSGNPELLKWYQAAELQNGRWAMAAVAGILFTDLVSDKNWWEAGTETYALDFTTLVIIQGVVMSVFEAANFKNLQEGKTPGVLGSPFDPAGMNSPEMALKEIKNGRLAMVAFIGFCSVAAVRGQGPIDALATHLADPYNNNLFTSKVGLEATVGVCALSIAPMIINAFVALRPDDDEEFRPIPW
ncbi:unnamed protein product [Pedinophyceae sp. YPF-701]|nr:unnamed protein product [Pedinophyceae sp. YPF-701]